jgi:cardiolipin synthase A/B
VQTPDLQDYAYDAGIYARGHRLRLLRSGAEAYPAMLEAIAAARRNVHLETYILRADRTGRRFGDALRERARAGVEVRLLYDAFGALGLDDDFVAALRADGVRVVAYRPVAPWRPRWGLWRRNHRKTLVVDGRLGFTGGLNIGDEYAAAGDGGGGWHDLHVQIEGPAVRRLATLFRTAWEHAGGDAIAEPAALTGGAGPLYATVIANEDIRSRFEIRRSYLHAIRRARSTIRIMNAYFIPDAGVRWALRRAARRGVDVRVVVPSVADVRLAHHASRHVFGRLLRAGVRILEWPGPMMHAKAVVVDGCWCAVGSYNLDYRSLLHDLEVVVAVLDRDFAGCVQEVVEQDVARCREITALAWRARPALSRLLEWAAYRLRRWL